MLFSNSHKKKLIYFEDNDHFCFWTKKWGITIKQLNESIIETGSININKIRRDLAKKGFLFSIPCLLKYLKHKYMKPEKLKRIKKFMR